ncbi:Cd(II)/Pb(II)-responsive transcriptional regulator [Candidimonas nitroreducens]|jgi:Cd(II)/Pb(II)-responsive transcriptional regulator|uniref:Cd(II)/Pb(II)-responsive transcriptional regulator n=1 Tax=Candidimonas nitroreducens TaxID=683354 RepID=A0A225MW85_9BURK|nr:Cd(II)/Pb(II)-responsive transcriptional regulator [Candidimonas nitroreducens]OWT65556.1 Cd(II)/Pb(II)-responsive transcriptional regulator [Candidimonas nitroreducens]
MSIRIGELAKRTRCPIVTIRYYETEDLLPPPTRSRGNYRLYDDAHVERLQFIRHCRSLDMTLTEVRKLLSYRDTPMQDCGEVNTLLDKHIGQVEVRVEALLQLKRNLLALREKCSGTRAAASCGILQGLSDCACHAAPENSAEICKA